MAKYNIGSTKSDWERLYGFVSEFDGLDIKEFKKSQNFDSAVYAFVAFVAKATGVSHKDVLTKYPLYKYDNTIRAVAN